MNQFQQFKDQLIHYNAKLMELTNELARLQHSGYNK